MAIRTRQDVFAIDANINATMIVPTSRLVSSVTGFPVQPDIVIASANAYLEALNKRAVATDREHPQDHGV